MKDSYEQRIQNQFGAFCVKVLKNEARYIQREYARLRDQEKSLGELTASELEQTAVWDKHFSKAPLRYSLMDDVQLVADLTVRHVQEVGQQKELREYLMKEGFEWPDK